MDPTSSQPASSSVISVKRSTHPVNNDSVRNELRSWNTTGISECLSRLLLSSNVPFDEVGSYERGVVRPASDEISANPPYINALPDDLMCMIFAGCLPEYSPSLDSEPSSALAPLLLCQVCKRWRNIAESHAELWSTLRCYLISPYFACEDNARFAQFQLWLQRSRGCPLSLDFQFFLSPRELELIFENCRRWYKLSLILDAAAGPEFLKLTTQDVPHLRKISLSISGDWETSRLPSVLQKFPALDGIWLSQGLTNMKNYNWRNLLQLVLFDSATISVGGCIDMLSVCQALEKFTIGPLCRRVDSTGPPPYIITLKNLHSLTLLAPGFERLLGHLTLPAFQQLRDRVSNDRGERCNPQSLTLMCLNVHLPYFEYVTNLDLWKKSSKATIDLLTWNPVGEENILPHLRRLSLRNYKGGTDGKISELISSRYPQSSESRGTLAPPLEFFRVWFNDIGVMTTEHKPRHILDLAALDYFAALGLRVEYEVFDSQLKADAREEEDSKIYLQI